MRSLFLGVVLVCSCGCGGEEAPPGAAVPRAATAELEIAAPPGYGPHPDQYGWQFHRIARGEPVAAGLHVRLDGRGRLAMRDGAAWRAATLDGLSEHLARARDRCDEEQRALGRLGREVDDRGSPGASRLVVDLELRPDTPWQHVCWLMVVCMEQRYDKLQVRAGARTIHLYLFWDAAIEWIHPLPHVEAKVRVLPRLMVEGRWPHVRVARSAAYFVGAAWQQPLAARRPHLVRAPWTWAWSGGTLAEDLPGVVAALVAIRRRAAADGREEHVVGVPILPAGMPLADVMDLFHAFLDAGVARLAHDWTLVPPPADRRAEVLRPPSQGGG